MYLPFPEVEPQKPTQCTNTGRKPPSIEKSVGRILRPPTVAHRRTKPSPERNSDSAKVIKKVSNRESKKNSTKPKPAALSSTLIARPRPRPRQGSMLEGEGDRTWASDLKAALPEHIFSPKSDVAVIKRGHDETPASAFRSCDLCLLLDCDEILSHIHSREEVAEKIGWTTTSIELFNDHLAHPSALKHSAPDPERTWSSSGTFETVEAVGLPDMRWKPCTMLDEFGTGTVELRLALPPVSEADERRDVGATQDGSLSLHQAYLESQEDLDSRRQEEGRRALIGPVQPLKNGKEVRNPFGPVHAEVWEVVDEMDRLGIDEEDLS